MWDLGEDAGREFARVVSRFRKPYCMNQPWLTTADWPLCTVVLAAA